jgi:hypothetical protein
MRRLLIALTLALGVLLVTTPALALAVPPPTGTIEVLGLNAWQETTGYGTLVVLGHPELTPSEEFGAPYRVTNVPAGTYQLRFVPDLTDFRSGGLSSDILTVTMGPDVYLPPAWAAGQLVPHYLGTGSDWWNNGSVFTLSNGYGTISGRVTDASGTPIPGAEVDLQWGGTAPANSWAGMRGVTATATADTQGYYTISTFAGPHDVVAKVPGLQPGVLACTLAPGQDILHDFVLRKSDFGSVSGVVFNGWSNPRHLPFPGAMVTLDASDTVFTGSDGSYRFDNVLSGDHELRFSYPGCWFSGESVDASGDSLASVVTGTVGGWAYAVLPVGGAPLVMHSDIFFTPESSSSTTAYLRRGTAGVTLAVQTSSVVPRQSAHLAVDVQKRIGGRWVTVQRTRTNTNGRARAYVKFHQVGKYAIRWAVDPKAKAARAYSRTLTVKVKR